MCTNSKILTTLYGHVFSTRLRLEFFLLITRTSTQQFVDHIPVCCQSISSLTGFPLLGWRSVTKTEGTASGFSVFFEGPNPSSTPPVKSSGRKWLEQTRAFLSLIGGSSKRSLANHYWTL